MATHFNLVSSEEIFWKQAFMNCTTRSAAYGTLRVQSQGALKQNTLAQIDILHQA